MLPGNSPGADKNFIPVTGKVIADRKKIAVESEEKMAEQALSTIGVVFGWGLGTLSTPPTAWTQIEECISIGGVSVTQDKLDATPLEARRKKYVGGHEDTGGELQTVFNDTDTFDSQWGAMLTAYEGRTKDQGMWFCAYHPSKTKMNVYIVEPGSLPAPEYAVGNVLQYTITNTLVDLPDAITAVKPTAPAASSQTEQSGD